MTCCKLCPDCLHHQPFIETGSDHFRGPLVERLTTHLCGCKCTAHLMEVTALVSWKGLFAPIIPLLDTFGRIDEGPLTWDGDRLLWSGLPVDETLPASIEEASRILGLTSNLLRHCIRIFESDSAIAQELSDAINFGEIPF